MEYKQTAEYAYDLLEHFYKKHIDQIKRIGVENITILCPTEILNLLEVRWADNFITTPEKYRKMDLKQYSGSTILFVLKEID